MGDCEWGVARLDTGEHFDGGGILPRRTHSPSGAVPENGKSPLSHVVVCGAPTRPSGWRLNPPLGGRRFAPGVCVRRAPSSSTSMARQDVLVIRRIGVDVAAAVSEEIAGPGRRDPDVGDREVVVVVFTATAVVPDSTRKRRDRSVGHRAAVAGGVYGRAVGGADTLPQQARCGRVPRRSASSPRHRTSARPPPRRLSWRRRRRRVPCHRRARWRQRRRRPRSQRRPRHKGRCWRSPRCEQHHPRVRKQAVQCAPPSAVPRISPSSVVTSTRSR